MLEGYNLWMLITGGLLILAGIFIRWCTSRYDIQDAVIDSALQMARGKRSSGNPTEIEKKLSTIASQETAQKKVKAAASALAGHVFSQVMAVVGLIMVLGGAALIAVGIWWR